MYAALLMRVSGESRPSFALRAGIAEDISEHRAVYRNVYGIWREASRTNEQNKKQIIKEES